MIQIMPGSILLTAGVGGPAAKWKDKVLSKTIILHERIQDRKFKPTRSHAELFVGLSGQTFAARWRTRERKNGLADYIGSPITIGYPIKGIPLQDFASAWARAEMDSFDGNIYPVHRILMQAIGTWLLPWVTRVGFGSFAMCSEIVAKFYADGLQQYQEFSAGWRGWTPADLEYLVRFGDAFKIIFDGILTEKIMNESGFPTYRIAGTPVKLVPND